MKHLKTFANNSPRHRKTFECVCDEFMWFRNVLGNVCICEWISVHRVPSIFEPDQTTSKTSWIYPRHVEIICKDTTWLLNVYVMGSWCFERSRETFTCVSESMCIVCQAFSNISENFQNIMNTSQSVENNFHIHDKLLNVFARRSCCFEMVGKCSHVWASSNISERLPNLMNHS